MQTAGQAPEPSCGSGSEPLAARRTPAQALSATASHAQMLALIASQITPPCWDRANLDILGEGTIFDSEGFS